MTHRSYITLNIFAVWIAAAAFVGAIGFWALPGAQDIALTQQIGWLVQAWNVMYLMGGFFSLVGIFTLKPRYELAGKLMLAPALIINGIAIATVHGTIGFISAALVVALGIACIIRIQVLLHAYRLQR